MFIIFNGLVARWIRCQYTKAEEVLGSIPSRLKIFYMSTTERAYVEHERRFSNLLLLESQKKELNRCNSFSW
jgi:hypothetical protein